MTKLSEHVEMDIHKIESMGFMKASFRQLLSRARKTLFEFMNQYCGMLNLNRSCRRRNKAKGFEGSRETRSTWAG
jgi:hypothetical protein